MTGRASKQIMQALHHISSLHCAILHLARTLLPVTPILCKTRMKNDGQFMQDSIFSLQSTVLNMSLSLSLTLYLRPFLLFLSLSLSKSNPSSPSFSSSLPIHHDLNLTPPTLTLQTATLRFFSVRRGSQSRLPSSSCRRTPHRLR
jgi:hypothetical protein